MVTASSSVTRHRLHLELPDSWVVSDPADVERVEEIARAAGLAVPPSDTADAPMQPDFVAALFQPVTLSGEPIEIVIASLVAWSFAFDTLPAAPDPNAEGRVLRGIETALDIRADFYVLTLPVVSQDGSVTTLLTFSTPNLPLAEPMDEAFRSIWATALVDVIDDQSP